MSMLADLIPSIAEKTEQGKLKWEELTADNFIARLGSNSFELALTRNGGIRLAFSDEAGRMLESTSDDVLHHPLDQFLVSLYQTVRRKSLRVDEQLDTAKAYLDKL